MIETILVIVLVSACTIWYMRRAWLPGCKPLAALRFPGESKIGEKGIVLAGASVIFLPGSHSESRSTQTL
jgi:hypothetical protein